MKYIPKALLSIIVGLILWTVCAVVFTLLAGYLLSEIGFLARIVTRIESSKLFGHLVPTIFRAIPCILPAYVVAKISNSSKTQLTVSLVSLLVAIVAMQIYGFFTGSGDMWWLIQGIIGEFVVILSFTEMN